MYVTYRLPSQLVNCFEGKHMKFISLAIMAMLLPGCVIWNLGNTSDWSEREYWKADGTSFGWDSKGEAIEGEGYVCYGTYVACQHMFTKPGIATEYYEPPVSPVDPNSNVAPPLDSLPGQ